jgi:putative DNA primase/helicase
LPTGFRHVALVQAEVVWLPTFNLKESHGVGLELRCASKDGAVTVMDVLPPSIHEETLKPYAWAGLGDWRNFPGLPEAFLALWRELAKPRSRKKSVREGVNVTEGGRNAYLFSRACSMRHAGFSEETILTAMLVDNSKKCDPKLGKGEVEKIVASAARYEPGVSETLMYSDRGGDGKAEGMEAGDGAATPIIDVRGGALPQIVQDAVSALKGAGAPIYLRGDALYRPVRIEAPPKDDDHVRRPVGAVVLRPVDSVWTRLQLAGAAAWRKWDAREKKLRPADPPKDIAGFVATQPDVGDWPVLRGVVAHLVLTFRGRLISDPGYDQGSGLLVDITGDWPIPAAPTRDDAVAAWERLKNLLRYFPWVSDTDRAVAISMLMTAIARPALPAAPMHAVDAPEAGTGKSLLVDAASILASGTEAPVMARPALPAAPMHAVDAPEAGTGKSLLVDAASILASGTEAPVMAYGYDAAEAGKRLDAMLLAGDPIISIDNVEAPIEGAALCQTLTQTTRRIRVLGLTKRVTGPCMAMLTATGNNLVLKGDVVRRVLLCRLDAQTEHPELRDFDQDLIAEASEHRKDLVADVITIMLAYQRAGQPAVGVTRFGSYEPWSRMVRQALRWVGEVDPCLSLERTRGGDPARVDLIVVLEAWHAAFGKDAVTAAEAIKEAWDGTDLRAALAAVCEKGGSLDTKALGIWLRDHRDRRSGDLVLRAAPGRAGVSRWVVTR